MDWHNFWNHSEVVKSHDPFRQVGRTFKQQPYSQHQVEVIVSRILRFLEPSSSKRLLELACGNGMLTSRIAGHFQSVTAIDFSKPLIDVARRDYAPPNVEYVVGDAIDLEGASGQYDCVLIWFAFQYFTPAQAEKMLAKLSRHLQSPSRILLGEVADGDRIWSFYRGATGRIRHLTELLRQKPTIGHWWKPADLHALASLNNMDLSIFYQNEELPNHYFRYDALLQTRA